MNISLAIDKVSVIIEPHSDLIIITLSDSLATPNLSGENRTRATIRAESGKGVEYCRKILKIEPKVIQGH